MNICYIGTLNPTGTCSARFLGLEQAGWRATAKIDTQAELERRIRLGVAAFRLPAVLSRKALNAQMQYKLSPFIAETLRSQRGQLLSSRGDLLWIDKGDTAHPSLISAFKKNNSGPVVIFNTDNPNLHPARWRWHDSYLPFVDIYVHTNKEYLRQLKSLHPRITTIHTYMGFDERHFSRFRDAPLGESAFVRSSAFIGHWEPATEKILSNLAGLASFEIAGQYWATRNETKALKPHIFADILDWSNYLEQSRKTRILLGISSKANSNPSTGRTFEIPAIGSMLLAEDTAEHREIFEAGKEVILFTSPAELRSKLEYFSRNRSEALLIARAAHKKVWTEEMTWQRRARDLAMKIEALVQ